MSFVGFYRVKVLADEDRDITLFVNGVATHTKSIKVIDACDDDLILKYLDKNGQYRFYPFYSKYEVRDNPEKIGSTNKFLTDILDDQSKERNIGYKNDRVIFATADVEKDMIDVVSDIYNSPRVYLYIGDSTDLAKDWLEVVISSNNIVRKRKGNLIKIDIEITLPEWYTIRMI
jgi:hypothetical protein